MAVSVTEVMFITTALCGIVVLLLFFKNRSFYTAAAKIPGPPAFPIIGNVNNFIGKHTLTTKTTMEAAKMYPSLFRLWIGHDLIVLVYDADQLQIILNSPKTISKGFVTKFTEPWLGKGLITAPEKKWRVHRRLIAPSFNMSVLRSFVGVIAKEAETMTTEMKKELQNGEFEIRHYVGFRFMTIMCETVMSTVNGNAEETRRYIKSAERAAEIMGLRLFKIWLYPDFIFNRTKIGKDFQQCVRDMHDFASNLIRAKKSASYDVSHIKNENKYNRPDTRKGFMDYMIDKMNDDQTLSDKDFHQEVDTLMITGYETVTSVICNVFLMLASYPEVQEFAYRELREIFGEKVSSDEPITENELERMEYLERVIKETMRLFPIVWIISHRVSEDLDIGNVILPKGCSVCPLIFELHRSEKYWSDPLKFDPNRFLPEEVAKRHPYCYLPFSGGPRNCIALNYAMMSMKIICATVLRRYILRKDDFLDIGNVKLRTDFTLKLIDNVKIRISER